MHWLIDWLINLQHVCSHHKCVFKKLWGFTSVTRQLLGFGIERRVQVVVPGVGVGVPARYGRDGKGELLHCLVLVRKHVTNCCRQMTKIKWTYIYIYIYINLDGILQVSDIHALFSYAGGKRSKSEGETHTFQRLFHIEKLSLLTICACVHFRRNPNY